MAAALQDHLFALQACIGDGDVAGNAQKAHGIVGDIGHVCLQDVTEKDVGKALVSTQTVSKFGQ